jgi:hypothetical protein
MYQQLPILYGPLQKNLVHGISIIVIFIETSKSTKISKQQQQQQQQNGALPVQVSCSTTSSNKISNHSHTNKVPMTDHIQHPGQVPCRPNMCI